MSCLVEPNTLPDPPPVDNPRFVRSRWHRLGVAAVAVALAATLAVSFTPLLSVVAFFVLVVPFERLFPRHDQPLRRPHLGTDVAYTILSGPIAALAVPVYAVLSVVSFAWVPGLALRPLVALVPPAPRLFLGVLLFDVAVYWAHRFGHEVPFWWRFHKIHHSPVQMDWASGFRAHPLDGVIIAPALALLLVAGFSAQFTGALLAVQLVTGLYIHANVRWRWRPLQRVVITPEFHHWHHANERDAHFSNYGVFFPVWDLIFGTYFMPTDRRPLVYGIDEPVAVGLAGQLIDPFRGLTPPREIARHPFRSSRRAIRAIPGGARALVASARRPRRSAACSLA